MKEILTQHPWMLSFILCSHLPLLDLPISHEYLHFRCLNDANQWICKCLNKALDIYLSVHSTVIIDVLVCITDLSLAQYYQWHQCQSNEPFAHIQPENRRLLSKHYNPRTCMYWLIYHKIYLCTWYAETF